MFGLILVMALLLAFELASAGLGADTSDGRDWHVRPLGGTGR